MIFVSSICSFTKNLDTTQAFPCDKIFVAYKNDFNYLKNLDTGNNFAADQNSFISSLVEFHSTTERASLCSNVTATSLSFYAKKPAKVSLLDKTNNNGSISFMMVNEKSGIAWVVFNPTIVCTLIKLSSYFEKFFYN